MNKQPKPYMFEAMLKNVAGKTNAPVDVVLRGGVKTVHGDVVTVDNGIVTIQNGSSHCRQKHMIDVREVVMVSLS